MTSNFLAFSRRKKIVSADIGDDNVVSIQFYVEVTPVNDTPVADDQSVTAREDKETEIILTGSDSDPELTQSLTYIFEEDLKEVKEFLIARGLEFDRLFDVEEDEHPIIFRFVQQRMIEVETYIIMDKILGFSKRIAKDIKDSYIFPSEQYRYDRYAEFLNLERDKYIKIMKEIFDATTE